MRAKSWAIIGLRSGKIVISPNPKPLLRIRWCCLHNYLCPIRYRYRKFPGNFLHPSFQKFVAIDVDLRVRYPENFSFSSLKNARNSRAHNLKGGADMNETRQSLTSRLWKGNWFLCQILKDVGENKVLSQKNNSKNQYTQAPFGWSLVRDVESSIHRSMAVLYLGWDFCHCKLPLFVFTHLDSWLFA